MTTWNCVGIDCGNSSVRIGLGQFDGNAFRITHLAQTPHREILVNGVWHWDILFLFERIKEGLRQAFDLCGRIDSAGISTWGIDHGLLAENGLLLANPLCYRNPFGQQALEELSAGERRALFDATGIQCDKINSVFQIAGYRRRYPGYWRAARDILLIPDLLNFFLTGEKNSEACIASTTQLYDARGGYAAPVFRKFDIDPGLFPPVLRHGETRGRLRQELADELGVNRFETTCVPGHDTAAAVAAIPCAHPNEHPLFISSGTWSLIGVECEKSLINDTVFAAGLANEAGIAGTFTLLKNSAGLFIAQRLKLECDGAGDKQTWDDIIGDIRMDGECGRIDPNAAEFFNPPSMRGAIGRYLEERGWPAPADNAGYFRVVYESLAHSYHQTIRQLEAVTGTAFPAIHIIGGGSKNRLLNQITAQATGKTVLAGPAEATSWGTMAAQLFREGSVKKLDDIRAIAAAGKSEAFPP